MQTNSNLMETMGVMQVEPDTPNTTVETTAVETDPSTVTETTVTAVTATAKSGAKRIAIMAGAGAGLTLLSVVVVRNVLKRHAQKKAKESEAAIRAKLENEQLQAMGTAVPEPVITPPQVPAASSEPVITPASPVVEEPVQPPKPVIETTTAYGQLQRPSGEEGERAWSEFHYLTSKVEADPQNALEQAIKESCITGKFLGVSIREFPNGITNIPFERSLELGKAVFRAMNYWAHGGTDDEVTLKFTINQVTEDGVTRNIPVGVIAQIVL